MNTLCAQAAARAASELEEIGQNGRMDEASQVFERLQIETDRLETSLKSLIDKN